VSVRDIVDSPQSQNFIAAARRVDDVVLALADCYRKIDALTQLAGPDDIEHEQMLELAAILHDHASRDRILAAATRLGQEGPAEWLARRNAEASAQPALPADRSPRSGRATPDRSILATETDPKTGEVVRAFGQSPLQPGEGGP
jgi:hypothetical protein